MLSRELVNPGLSAKWLIPVTVCLILLCSIPLTAQQSTIQGVVKDTSGALIPGAKVTVTKSGAGAGQTTAANQQGFYSVPFLIPGTYSVKVSAEGFASKTLTGLTLDVSTTARADFTLEVGKVEMAIEVTATAALLDTETSTGGQVIDNKRIVELPLNGRNYLQLAQLATGVGPAAGGVRSAGNGSFSALGSRAYQTNIVLDGVDNGSRYGGGELASEAQLVTPSVDAVQEFKVVTNNNSAEFGFRMGGTVIVQTKSGSNQYHGTAYEFLRNDKFAANNFFANAAGQDKTVYKRNQFGATLGGKLITDKTFFFGSYEGTRIRIGGSSRATVPLAARKNGDFSDRTNRLIFDPATTRQVGAKWVRDAFPKNTIPSSRFDPLGVKIVALYPDPNISGATNNYFYSPSNQDDTNQYDGRLDHNFNASHRIFFRYSRRVLYTLDPGPLPLPADGGSWQNIDLTANSYVGNWNAVLSPVMNNEFRVGYTRTASVIDLPWTENYNAKLGVPGIPDFGAANARGMMRVSPAEYTMLGPASFSPNKNDMNLLQFFNHLTRVQGRHVRKFGFEYRAQLVSRLASRFARGFMQFNRSFTQDPNNRAATGDGVADLLLGLASGGNFGNPTGEPARTRHYAIFFQDDWKLTDKFTLNLGLRWDRFGLPTFENYKVMGRYILGPPGTSQYQLERPKGPGDPGGEHDNNNFAPRVGLAYQLRRSTVVRSGFGIFYATPDGFNQDSMWANGPPEWTEFNFPTDRLVQPGLVLSQGFPGHLFPVTTVRENVNLATKAEKRLATQYAMQWFFDLQQQLPFQTVLTLSYMGNGSRQMLWQRNLNGAGAPGPGSLESREAWPFWGSINVWQAGGNSSYHGFAAKAEKRFSQGLTFLASYTLSHAIDDGPGVGGDGEGTFRNSFNIAMDRSNSLYDHRHALSTSFIYDLPFGRGRKWGSAWNPVARHALGGWQVGGILTLRSGWPYSVTVSGDPANNGGINYANRLRQGDLPASQRSIDRWYDLAAFAIPQQYTYGNGGRNILVGPRTNVMDLKIGKNFNFAERYRVELRCEMFNFTNTPNFGAPNGTLNAPNAGMITGAGSPRIVQFGLKLAF